MNRRQVVLLAALALSTSAKSIFGATQPPRLRIGLTAVILADQAAFLSRWSRYLEQRLQCPVSFVVRESYQDVNDLLFANQLDAAWICGYPYVLNQTRLKLLAVPLYQGKPLYRSYLIRPRGDAAKIRNWADLRGKVLAYSDPLSNSGWLVAQSQLAANGIGARDLKRSFFTHGHSHVAEAVAARLASAGSIDGYVWETMRLQGMAAAEQTEVAWQSDLYGFPPLVVHRSPSHPRTETLQQALLAMGADEEGRTLLNELNLDGVIAGEPALFQSIRKLALIFTPGVQSRGGLS